MHLDPQKHLVIDDAYICDFMVKNGTTDFMEMCESVIKTICMAASQRKDQGADELLMKVKTELLDAFSQRKVDLGEVTKTILSLNESNMVHISSKLEKIPQVLTKVDELKNKIDVSKAVEETLSRRDDSMSHVHKTLDQVNSRLELLSATRNTNRFKGEEGETGLMDILENKLPLRDGYTIQDVKTIPHNCDILVQRTGFPDIRVESKAHGRDNGRNVNPAEVRRFEADLLGLDSHGIFVSLYTGISGKGPIEIELLPTNKFAVYLSNNNFDGDTIKEYVNLIYKLDQFTNESDGLTISADAILRIKNHLTDFSLKIASIKSSLKTTLATLSDISFDVIEKILSSHQPKSTPSISSTVDHPCPHCLKNVKTAAALASHIRTCKSRPSEATPSSYN